jgi:tight adherence protein B
MMSLLLGGGIVFFGIFILVFRQTLSFNQQQTRYAQRVARIKFDGNHRVIEQRDSKKSLDDWLQTGVVGWILGLKSGVLPVPRARMPILLIGAAILALAITEVLRLLIGGPLMMIYPAMVILVIRFLLNHFRKKRTSLLLSQLPDALATIVRCIRSGIPIQGALRIVGRDLPEPTAGEFRDIANRLAIGVTLEEALRAISERNGIAEYKFFAAALGLQSRTGGALAQTLETLATVVHKRIAAKARAYALAAEARTSALILGCLPVLTGIAIALLDPKYMAPFVTTLAGKHLLLVAIGLLCFGFLVMKTIISRSLS